MPTKTGQQIRCGDTIIVEPRRRDYGQGDILLISDRSEYTLVRCGPGEKFYNLRDNAEAGVGILVVGLVVELRHTVDAR